MTTAEENMIVSAKQQEKREKISGVVASVVVHLLLLLLFILLKLPANEIAGGTAPAEEGILIDFGNTPTGMGNENALQKNQNASSSQSPETSPDQDERVVTQNIETSVTISHKTKTKTQTQVAEPQPDQDLLKALNKLNNPGQTSGQGISDTPGNEGSPDGKTGAAGSSEGNSDMGKWRLRESGRKMIGKIEIDYNVQEQGTVAVEIIVDKYGKIIRATPVLMGSTTTNLYLWNKAKEGLQGKALFNQSPSGEEAKGMIYINFILK